MEKEFEIKTYFCIQGDFNVDEVISLINLKPNQIIKKGDYRIKKLNDCYDFSALKFGLIIDSDIQGDKQIEKTISTLWPKIDILKEIKQKYDVSYCLEIVPKFYKTCEKPIISPSKDVIKFCYLTDTEIDYDYYFYFED